MAAQGTRMDQDIIKHRHAISTSLRTAQIGASGVLLIQYRLLKHGIESAPMTTDAGIDLVVYAPKLEKAVTVQVKTCFKAKPAGGKGPPQLDWRLRRTSPAELVGLVSLHDDQVWLFRHDEFYSKAQQKPDRMLHLYFYVEPDYRARDGCHVRDFEAFRIERRMEELFGAPQISK
jgi:hypothetical protein